MFLSRPSWERVTKNGIPPLTVIRDIPGSQFKTGDPYPVDVSDKRQVTRARQYFEQRRIDLAPQPQKKEPSKQDGTAKVKTASARTRISG